MRFDRDGVAQLVHRGGPIDSRAAVLVAGPVVFHHTRPRTGCSGQWWFASSGVGGSTAACPDRERCGENDGAAGQQQSEAHRRVGDDEREGKTAGQAPAIAASESSERSVALVVASAWSWSRLRRTGPAGLLRTSSPMTARPGRGGRRDRGSHRHQSGAGRHGGGCGAGRRRARGTLTSAASAPRANATTNASRRSSPPTMRIR